MSGNVNPPRPAEIAAFEERRRRKERAGRAGRRRWSYSEPFAGRIQGLLESPAFRALSRSAHMALARIELEFIYHGGNPMENGRLIVTHEQFRDYGIEKDAVAPALRELEALGFIEIVRAGAAGNEREKRSNVFRLTYLPSGTAPGDGTHEWRAIATAEDAERRAKTARASKRRQEDYRVVKRRDYRPTPPKPVSAE